MTFSSRTLHIYPDLFGAVERNPDDSLLQDRFHDAVALLLFQVSNVLEDFKISLHRDLSDIAPILRELANHASRLADHFMMLEMIATRLGQAVDLGADLLHAMETFEHLSIAFDYITHSPAPGIIAIQKPEKDAEEIAISSLLSEMTAILGLMNRFALAVCQTSLARITGQISDIAWKVDGTDTDIDFVLQNLMLKKLFIS